MNRMKETLQGTALLVAVTHGFLAWSLAGANPSWAQDKEALDICLNSEREPVVRVEACRTAAEQGDAEAQFSLGVMYDNGEGVSQDYAEAVKWYRLAAEQGLASAQADLGYMYASGRGVPQDDAEAVKWFRLATEQGHASGQFRLGIMYYDGEGVPQDYAEAVKWYRLAVEQGNASAQFMLKHMCLDPEREPGVRVEACHIAAEQGNASAQFRLGVRYDTGEGVPQDYGEAVKWFRHGSRPPSAFAFDSRQSDSSGKR